MRKSLVREAATAFNRGDFGVALELYKKAEVLLGENLFNANISLTRRRILAARGKSYTNMTLKATRVACVMDEFTFSSYKDICTLQQLSIDSWRTELEQFQPDILFIESAWRGKDDGWNRKISQASPELLGALEWCNEKSIPTMFWNKEDPVHFGTFLNTAKRFDYVFTTDLNCIADYKRSLGHDQVYLLPFACNPVDHNPIEKYQRKPKSCFAGSFYVRYPERIRDLDVLLETFIEHSGVDIYDRNYGKEDENYAFPDKYKPLILGSLKYNQIDIAYKGYEYGINMNSIKYSPTMFARRVFELLASRTLVVSNYSKGVRLLFGDLVICSDAKSEITSKLERHDSDSDYADQVKLAGLRKVMLEHTYENRFTYIAQKVLGCPEQNYLPLVHVLVMAKTQHDVQLAIKYFNGQSYERKMLHILALKPGLQLSECRAENVRLVEEVAIRGQWVKLDHHDFAAWFDLNNFYGEHYLLDLALATKYTSVSFIAKAMAGDDGIANSRGASNTEYSFSDHYFADAALVSGVNLDDLQLAMESCSDGIRKPLVLNSDQVFVVDRQNFLPRTYADKLRKPCIDTGIHMAPLIQHAEATPSALALQIRADKHFLLQGSQLYTLLNIRAAEQRGIECTVQGTGLNINVATNAQLPHYIYTNDFHPLNELWKNESKSTYFDSSPGLELAPVVVFFDAEKNRVGHVILIANWNQTLTFPENAKYCRLGIRVAQGSGQANVKNWVFDHVPISHRFNWAPSSHTLVISANYPTYNDYYRYAFVHRRIKGYKEHELKTDIFRFRQGGDLELYEFEDIDVVSGGPDVLNTILACGRYKTIAIHALDQLQWDVLSTWLDKTKVVIWLHGSEIQSWKRRTFNYTTQQEIDRAQASGKQRDTFWKKIFNLRHPNLHFVFVSKYFKDEVLDDLQVTCMPSNVHVIHNPIDASLFQFIKKAPAQRKKILSIRPYASRVYANDLMVKAIVELSSRSYFNELEFMVIGNGVLFDETVEPLKQFKNVTLLKGFLSQSEIAKLHRDYGIFLCPSRMDTQGVSRDEAMSSGLVPVTNRVGAISEFVPENAGFLCEPESYRQLADSLEALYLDASLFCRMSDLAASTIRANRSSDLICSEEIHLLSDWKDL
nr:glycosyltransferase [uncultured Undibacterium sp.]